MSKRIMTALTIVAVSFVVAFVALAEKPKLKTEIKQDDKCKLDWVWSMYVKGNNLFVVSHRDGDVNIFAIDKSGDLKFQNSIDLNKDLGKDSHLDGYTVLTDKNILYVTGAWTHHKNNSHGIGLSWYKVDPTTGASVKGGNISCDVGTIHQSPADANMLYLAAFYSNNLQMIKLDNDGKPSVAGKVDGKGLGLGLAISPDGKQVYSMSKGAVGWANIGAGGALTYGGSLEFDGPESIDFSGIAISPDGKNVYTFQAKKYGTGVMGIFARDAAGKLTVVETVTLEKGNPLNGITSVVFSPDGENGYFSGGPETKAGGLGYFSRDPATGKVTYGGKADGGMDAYGMAYVPQTGAIYLGGNFSSKSFKVFSVSPQAVPAGKGK